MRHDDFVTYRYDKRQKRRGVIGEKLMSACGITDVPEAGMDLAQGIPSQSAMKVLNTRLRAKCRDAK